MSAWIYALTDPETGDVRYVGVTRKDPRKRMMGHMVEIRAMWAAGNSRHEIADAFGLTPHYAYRVAARHRYGWLDQEDVAA